MRVLHIVGARPNFMKAAPVIAALRKQYDVQQLLVHSGQHYDFSMSEVFFQQLGMPAPDLNLEVGSGTHTFQTAQAMLRLEGVVTDHKSDLVVVYGDVNSTLAAALVGVKLEVPVAHVEAGLRSFDRTMPEEINRILTDQIADLLFTPSQDADENLLREGVTRDKIYFVGNVMIDTLVHLLPLALDCWQDERMTVEGAWVEKHRYVLVTLHRPSNVDDPANLHRLITALNVLGQELPIVFPVHPRTQQRITGMSAGGHSAKGIRLIAPLGYLEFLALQRHAALVITDSGGIQEETTYLGVPCLTVRENTERPVTVTMGTNTLVGRDLDTLLTEARLILKGGGKTGAIPPLWDGHAADRIATIIVGGQSRSS